MRIYVDPSTITSDTIWVLLICISYLPHDVAKILALASALFLKGRVNVFRNRNGVSGPSAASGDGVVISWAVQLSFRRSPVSTIIPVILSTLPLGLNVGVQAFSNSLPIWSHSKLGLALAPVNARLATVLGQGHYCLRRMSWQWYFHPLEKSQSHMRPVPSFVLTVHW